MPVRTTYLKATAVLAAAVAPPQAASGSDGNKSADGNTLVSVTADHGHSSQIVEELTEDDLRNIAEDTKQPSSGRDVMHPGLDRAAK